MEMGSQTAVRKKRPQENGELQNEPQRINSRSERKSRKRKKLCRSCPTSLRKRKEEVEKTVIGGRRGAITSLSLSPFGFHWRRTI